MYESIKVLNENGFHKKKQEANGYFFKMKLYHFITYFGLYPNLKVQIVIKSQIKFPTWMGLEPWHSGL